MGSNLKDEKETDQESSKEEYSGRGNVRCKGPEVRVGIVCGRAEEGPQAGEEQGRSSAEKGRSGHTGYMDRFNFLKDIRS